MHVCSGKLKHLLRELSEISDDLLKVPLERMYSTNKRGELVESDADEEGNLAYVLCCVKCVVLSVLC